MKRDVNKLGKESIESKSSASMFSKLNDDLKTIENKLKLSFDVFDLKLIKVSNTLFLTELFLIFNIRKSGNQRYMC